MVGDMFEDRDYRMTCIDLIWGVHAGKNAGYWWDDEAKSLTVSKSVTMGPALGRWEKVYMTEPFEYTISVGSDFEDKTG